MPTTVNFPIGLGTQGWAMVTQGFGGSTSHTGSLYYSLDLTLGSASIYGAPYIAHGTGTVIDLRENVPEGTSASTGTADPSNGPSNLGNFITVAYNSGEVVTYAHIKTNGVVPAEGATITAGQVLGYIGNTGYRTGTHGHITYGLNTIEWTTGTVADGSSSGGLPVNFDTASGLIGPGIVSQVSFSLGSLSLPSDRHNLYLLGSNAINGTGDAYANIISGNRGNNVLDGQAGNDQILGGSGDDTLIGGAGNDVLNGGSGIDTANYAVSSSGVSVNLAITSSQNTGSATGYDTLVSIENIAGGAYADSLSGSSATNRLYGGGGNDVLNGMSGNDYLFGEAGNDVLVGGAGRDALYGGSGNDRFDFNSPSESGLGSSYRDVIYDFQSGDLIDLSTIDANSRISGDQAFKFIGSQSFHGLAGELRFANGILAGDIDGNGVADFEIQVLNLTTLYSSNFIL